MKEKIIYICILSACVGISAAKGKDLGFDTSFFNDFSAQDAKMLSGELVPGFQVLNFRLNDKPLGQYSVNVIQKPKTKALLIQLTGDMINKMHAKPILLKALKHEKYQLSKTDIQYVSYTYDHMTQTINILVPQSYIYDVKSGATAPPALWEFGISGGVMNYNIDSAFNHDFDNDNASVFGSAQLHYNLGRWQLYSNMSAGTSYNKSNGVGQTQNSADITYTYVTTIIPSWRSRLMLGYNNIQSNIFSGNSFYGATLNNNTAMLPQDEQQFKPVVQGVASTPITIELYQNNKLIYKTHLNPGPYKISDYNAVAGLGDITEIVTDNSGHKTQSTIPFQYVSSALYPGVVMYDANIGLMQYHTNMEAEFLEAEVHYGLSNYLSPYVGVFVNPDYVAEGVGTSINLGQYGALNLVTSGSMLNAKTTQGTRKLYSGLRAQVSYDKSFVNMGSSFDVVGYFYQTRHYVGVGQAFSQSAFSADTDSGQKNNFSINISQSLFWDMSLNANVSYSQQWSNDNELTADLSLNQSFQLFNYSISYDQSKVLNGENSGQLNRSISFNISFNFGEHGGSLNNSTGYDMESQALNDNISYALSSDSGKTSANIGYSYTRQLQQANTQNNSVNIGVSQQTNFANIDVTGNMQSLRNYSVSANISGGLVYTRYTGVQFMQYANDTFAVIDTDGVSGVNVDGLTETNHNGYGLYNSLMPYYYNDILLSDTQHQNGVLETHEAYAVPVQGAILYRKFKAKVGQSLFIKLNQSKHANVDKLIDMRTGEIAEHVYGNLYYFNTVKEGDHMQLQTTTNKLVNTITISKLDHNEITI
ncbi:fimbria/pilus outer membrane usher protein [Cysteiniphilum halobium]|uniref:fimbria/pilus outer membrane usher protein n=1 Tax=Cysteiniphilum halobium TaxID=2219059 RepID=UPI000E65436A|nr:fimbria/pilus outer membrane usher protein [Cysteiniphilum halobium]